MWEHRGQKRPSYAEEPRVGQESVWDYPRPPAIEECQRRAEVYSAGVLIARTRRLLRVLETASPPGIYIPNDSVDWSKLKVLPTHTYCEWKGRASYWSLTGDPEATPVAWSYPNPTANYAALRDMTSFYPGRVACWLDDEAVQAQAGDFYGGWVTSEIVGPFKGEPGTGHW